MRTKESYAESWGELVQDQTELENEKAELEERLDVVKKQIAHLEEVLRHLAPLAGIDYRSDLSDFGITDAIRAVMQDSTERMSPQDVRLALENKHFDFSGYSAPMSSIYKILGRFHEDPDIPIKRQRDGNSVYYIWERPTTEISDDDIPF